MKFKASLGYIAIFSPNNNNKSPPWWYTPVILATREAKIGLWFKASPRKSMKA
jgi:hypothetical protein